LIAAPTFKLGALAPTGSGASVRQPALVDDFASQSENYFTFLNFKARTKAAISCRSALVPRWRHLQTYRISMVLKGDTSQSICIVVKTRLLFKF
jgi:hypothetical protein